jgi:hypothetical protein
MLDFGPTGWILLVAIGVIVALLIWSRFRKSSG